jgi:hypothetical protein
VGLIGQVLNRKGKATTSLPGTDPKTRFMNGLTTDEV